MSDSLFTRKLAEALIKRRDEYAEVLISGSILSGDSNAIVPNYAHRVGYISGLSDALKIMEVVYDEINKG